MLVGMEFNAMLPVNERPEYTEGREGFIHLFLVSGTVESTKMVYIIRDHVRALLEKRKQYLMDASTLLNHRLGEGHIELEIKDQYYNMREQIEPVFQIVETAREAILSLGIEPIIVPVRGGTDGSRLSYMGLPTPNLFTGGLYAHGKYECLPTRSLERSVDVILRIIDLVSNK